MYVCLPINVCFVSACEIDTYLVSHPSLPFGLLIVQVVFANVQVRSQLAIVVTLIVVATVSRRVIVVFLEKTHGLIGSGTDVALVLLEESGAARQSVNGHQHK